MWLCSFQLFAPFFYWNTFGSNDSLVLCYEAPSVEYCLYYLAAVLNYLLFSVP